MSEQQQEWQPIETAPKDDELILLYDDRCGVRAGYWDTISDTRPFWLATETQIITSGELQPTHWMPLPAPPRTTPEGSTR